MMHAITSRSILLPLSVIGFAVTVACGGDEGGKAAPIVDGGTTPPDAGGPPPGDGSTPIDGNIPATGFTGTVSTTFVTDSVDESRPEDYSKAPPTALVANATGYDIFPGQGDTTGKFTIPNLAPGTPSLLKFGQFYQEHSGGVLDVKTVWLGRAAAKLASANTKLTLSMTGMTAWQDFDYVSLVSSNAGVMEADYTRIPGSVNVTDGSTSLNVTVDHAAAATRYLIDAAAGDDVFVLHGSVKASSYCITVADSFDTKALTMTDGQTTTLTGMFTQVAQSSTLNVAWKRSFYEAHRLSVHPTAVATFQTVSLLALPGYDRFGPYQGGATLLFCSPATLAATDENLSVTYGNPLPARFVPYIYAYESFNVPVAAPGATPLQVEGFIIHWHAASATTLEAPISPARNLKLDGQNAQSAMTGLSTTPVITWDAPQVGTVSRYAVSLYEIWNESGATRQSQLATLVTKGTSVRVPPGVFAAGKTYYATVMAQHDEGRTYEDIDTKGFSPTLGGDALTVSNAFTL